MSLFGIYLAGCALLVAAGLMKAARPADTARALGDTVAWLPRRGLRGLVRSAAAAEAGLGAAAIVWPARPLAVAVAVSYAAFGLFILYARARGGALASCGCFGSPDTPATRLHLAIDGGALAAAVTVAAANRSGLVTALLSPQYGHGVPLVAASGAAGVLAYLVMAPMARMHALREMGP